nr:cell wall anchor protein [Flavonifractor plautii]
MRCAAGLLIAAALLPTAFAADPLELTQPNGAPAKSQTLWGEEEQGSGANSARQGGASGADFVTTSYPTSVTRSEDGAEIHKVYDLSPEQDPAGIPRSDFEQDGFHYTLTDLLQQELPEYESRPHTETVSLESKSKDMESVLALLPQEKEFVTEDGLSGTLSLQLDTVQVEAAGYGSSTREVSATRSYPNLASQDTASIPKSIEEDGRPLTLQNIDWRTDNTASVAGYAMGDRYTAVATYTGTATSSYVTGYTVTADYSGTVSRIALNRVRYVAIFEGEPLEPAVPMEEPGDGLAQFNWAAILLPLGVVFTVGGVIGACLFVKRRRESKEEDTE